MRIPGFFVWEGRQDIIKPGEISQQVYSLMDILPTTLHLTKSAIPANLDGINIMPNLYEKEIKNRFIHYYRGGAFYAIRYGKWKFHLWTRPGEDCGFLWYKYKFMWTAPPVEHKNFLIFDLNQDPGERHPIPTEKFMEQHPEDFKAVIDEIVAHKESMKNIYPNQLEISDPDGMVCCDKSRNCDCRDKKVIE